VRFNKILMMMCCAAILLTVPMFADTVSGTAGAGWQSLSGVTLVTGNYAGQNSANTGATATNPYWDHPSFDATNSSAGCNIGWAVTGGTLAGCNNNNGGPMSDDGPANAYWGNSNGTFDPSFTFSTSTSPEPVELELTMAGNSNNNSFGWYTVGAGGVITEHQLFAAGTVAEATTTFTPPTTGQYGFYIYNGVNTFFTQSSLNSGDTADQHFALFRADPTSGSSGLANTYYLGAEDSGNPTDWDYNDMIVQIGPDTVPEPGTLPLTLAMGLGICAYALRRRFSSSN